MTDILNLFPDPQFLHVERWTAYNTTISVDTGNQAMNVTNANGSTDSYAKLVLDFHDYRGVSMTIACSLSAIAGDATQCYDGLLWVSAYNSRMFIPWVARDDGGATVGRKVVQFTMPGDMSNLELRLHAPATKDSIFQWRRPILTRTEDYQRLLAGTGIGNPMDYFDGDTRTE